MFQNLLLLSIYITYMLCISVCGKFESELTSIKTKTPNPKHEIPMVSNYANGPVSVTTPTIKAFNITTSVKGNRTGRVNSIFSRSSPAPISDRKKLEQFLEGNKTAAKYVPRSSDEIGKPKGSVSKLGYFPAQADIKDASTSKHKCSGTLVEDKHVLTTAHCVFKSAPNQLAVMAGDTSLLPGQASTRESRRVEFFAVHSDYVDDEEIGLEFNIAILRLDMPFSRGNYLHPAVIPNKDVDNNTLCFLVGWEFQERNGTQETTSFDLYYADVQTMDMEQCYKCVGHAICAGRNATETCIGDEGGPLMCNGVLHGIYMTSANNCQALTGIYTDVAFYKHWINRIIDWGGDGAMPVPLPYARKSCANGAQCGLKTTSKLVEQSLQAATNSSA